MKKTLLYVLLLLNSLFVIAQVDYYTATTGNNANSGTLSSPWKTIQYGVNQLSPGDTLNIMAGTYEEKIDIDVSGAETAYITIRNYQDNTVVLDAINFSNDDAIIWTDNACLQIEGLHLTNNIKNNATGITIQGAAHHISLIDNKISNIRFTSDPYPVVTPSKNAVPLNIWADAPLDSIHNVIIRGNEVFNNLTGYSENITGGGNFSTFIIENNIVHDNTNIGIDITGNYGVCATSEYDQGRHGIIRNNIVYNCNANYSTAAGIYIDGGKDIIVENNISHHNGYGGEIGCEENGTTSAITFRNNIFYKNNYAGMAIGGYDEGTTGIVLDARVYGNTFYKNDVGENYDGELLLTELDDCKIMNNIFYVSDQDVFLEASRTQQNFVLNYNTVYHDSGSGALVIETADGSYSNLVDYYLASGQGSNSIFSNPLFVDAVTYDFHLLEDSLSINAGDPLYIVSSGEVDMDHHMRIHNNIIDCGAYEYGALPLGNTAYYTTNSVFPNPFVNEISVTDHNMVYYKIISIDGRILSKGKIKQGSIELSRLQKGVYILLLEDTLQNIKYKEQIIKY